MKKFLKLTAIVLVVASLAVGLISCKKAEFDPNKNVSVVTREDGSGTKSAFMEIIGLKGKKDISGVIVASSTAAVLNEVKNNPYAVAFDSLGYADDSVKIVKIDGVYPSIATIKDGSYKIARPLNVVYQEANVSSGLNKAYLDFLNSTQAQEIITANGYVSTKDNTATYDNSQELSGEIKISGSTSLQPLMKLLAQKFETLHPNVTVQVGGGGSGTGYNDAKNSVSDFGMISETFKQEKAEGCVYSEVAKDGIAVIVNKSNTCDSLSMETVKNMYNSEAGDAQIKTWVQAK